MHTNSTRPLKQNSVPTEFVIFALKDPELPLLVKALVALMAFFSKLNDLFMSPFVPDALNFYQRGCVHANATTTCVLSKFSAVLMHLIS